MAIATTTAVGILILNTGKQTAAATDAGREEVTAEVKAAATAVYRHTLESVLARVAKMDMTVIT